MGILASIGHYAGIGSRKTPASIMSVMSRLARALEGKGFTLRSGAAEGADAAFEAGVRSGRKEIYLPWPGFNRHTSALSKQHPKASEIARELHPVWDRLSQGAQKLHSRNVHQVLGADLKTPSKFVVAWTPDAAKSAKEVTASTGGTGMAIKIADRHGVPVFNLANENDLKRILKFIEDEERKAVHKKPR
jgi:hypothetical protein